MVYGICYACGVSKALRSFESVMYCNDCHPTLGTSAMICTMIDGLLSQELPSNTRDVLESSRKDVDRGDHRAAVRRLALFLHSICHDYSDGATFRFLMLARIMAIINATVLPC